MTWIGVLALIYSAVNTLIPPATVLVIMLGDITLGLVLIFSGIIMTRRHTAPGRVAWVFAAEIAAVCLWGAWAYVADPAPVHLLYVAMLMTALGPLTAAYRPFIIVAGVLFVAVAGVLAYVGGRGTTSWIVGISCGLALSTVLLRIRVRSIRELDKAAQATLEASTRDNLTGVLNRGGLRDRLPALWADALRRSELITVSFLDVHGLKNANDRHGHDLGDSVLQDAAAAITKTVRGSDLVARWGGDEFIIVGTGTAPDVDTFSARLNEMFTSLSQARREGKVGEISVGQASGTADGRDFEQLLREADTQMYARRVGDTVSYDTRDATRDDTRDDTPAGTVDDINPGGTMEELTSAGEDEACCCASAGAEGITRKPKVPLGTCCTKNTMYPVNPQGEVLPEQAVDQLKH